MLLKSETAVAPFSLSRSKKLVKKKKKKKTHYSPDCLLDYMLP